MTLLLVFCLVQNQDPARLIERLRSDAVEEREEAERLLKGLGVKALPELEKAARGSDAEVAARARHLLKIIPVAAKLSPELRKAMPGIEERLASGGPKAWTQAFLDAAARPGIADADLESLAGPALQPLENLVQLRQICEVVGDRRLRGAIPDLVKVLRRGGANAKHDVTRALKRLKAREAIPELLLMLKEGGPGARDPAIEALAALRAREAIPELLRMIREDRSPERAQAASALAVLKAREAIPDLIRLLGDSMQRVRYDACQALSTLKAFEAVPEMLKLLKDPDAGLRGTVAIYLSWMGATKAAPALRELLEDGDPNVRAQAIRALGALGGPEDVPVLRKFLKGSDTNERNGAMWALRNLGATEAIPELLADLGHENPDLRSTTASVLGDWGVLEAIPGLIQMISDADANAQAAAIRALGSLIPPEAAAPLLKVLQEGPHREMAALALGELGTKEAIPELLARLDPSKGSVSWSYVEALGRLNAKEAVPLMVKLLHAKEGRNARQSIALWLCALGSREGVPAILNEEFELLFLNALRSPEGWAKLRAVRIGQDRKGTRKEIATAFAREAGMTIEEPADAGDWWTSHPARVARRGVAGNLLEGFQRLLGPERAIVLESDRIRILSREDAQAYWEAWWAKERSK